MRSLASIKSHPLHPMAVAFPIGLLVTSFFFDLLARWEGKVSLSAAAWYCVVAGLIGALFAIVPGAIDLFRIVPPKSSARTRGYQHAIVNILSMGAFLAVAAYRRGPGVIADDTSLVLSAIGVLLIGISGWLGATLVYRNQIAVDHRYANAAEYRKVDLTDWSHSVCRTSDLADGQIILAEIQGARIAVGRCSQGVVAFSDQCPHKGGPLFDGALIGCTVQCPWHGSQFDVVSGRVIAGPAKEPVIIYDVVTRGDEVFVYPKRGEEKPGEKVAA